MGTNIRNWPAKHRGFAVGVPVGFLGLGAAIFAGIASIFFYREEGKGRVLDVGQFLTFMGITCAVIAFQAAFTLRDVRHLKPTEILGALDNTTDEDVTDEVTEAEASNGASTTEQTALLRPAEHHSTSIRQLDALLLAGVLFAVGGAGLTYINNVGAIIVAVFPDEYSADNPEVQQAQKFHVALLSIASCSGRVIVGVLSDIFEKRFHFNRLFWPLTAVTLMLGGQMLGAITKDYNQLVLVTSIIGVAYGAANTAFPVVVAHLFGADGFSTNW
ncbi:hypothetical protein HDV00_008301 [Rhizophlyctis rosea]|nr:hypothetical protein HDV00_008301 [Rhizophlyctis rosea]